MNVDAEVCSTNSYVQCTNLKFNKCKKYTAPDSVGEGRWAWSSDGRVAPDRQNQQNYHNFGTDGLILALHGSAFLENDGETIFQGKK